MSSTSAESKALKLSPTESPLRGGIEKLLASLGSAKFAMHKSCRVATFPGWDNPLVAVPPLRYNGSQEGAA